MKKEDLYEQLKTILKSYMDEENLELIDKYYNYAEKIHNGMYRLNNEEYITHPLRVSIILAKLGMNTLTIGCSLIHESLTLEVSTPEEISNIFGEDTLQIVSSISKLSHLKGTFTKEGDEQRYRRIVVGLSENPIALFIKLADRLDNLRTLDYHDKEHIDMVVTETEKIYIPIAHRLGIKSMKSELEDLCLRWTNPTLYNEVLDKISSSKEELETSLYKMRDELIDLLNENEIKYELTYRVKSVRGIFNKLKSGKKWEQIYDLLGLRILLDKVEECYLVVGLIHSKYRPIPNRFKDYIANPKNNMYQSLHTTIFGVDSKVFEIQIRTHEMDKIAEKGVASHWSYKEKTDGSKNTEVERVLSEFRTLIEVNDASGNSDFFTNFENNLAKEFIYVFTPKGDVIELPKDSTPIDFAYKIHSEVGNTTIGALVNGKLVSLDYKLNDADIIDLKREKGKSPSKEWLKFVKTDNAKSRIRSYFYKKDKDKSIETGNEIIKEELKKRKYNPSLVLTDEIITKLCTYLKADDYNDVCLGLSTLKYTSNQVINKLIDLYDPKVDDTLNKLLTTKQDIKPNQDVLVEGKTGILCTLASCCSPILGDDIIGYITKGKGVLVHRKDCKMININSERLIDVSWNNSYIDKFICNIKVHIDSNNDRLIDIITLATKTDVVITSINNKSNDIYELTCKVKDKSILDKFMTLLSNLSFISEVER